MQTCWRAVRCDYPVTPFTLTRGVSGTTRAGRAMLDIYLLTYSWLCLGCVSWTWLADTGFVCNVCGWRRMCAFFEKWKFYRITRYKLNFVEMGKLNVIMLAFKNRYCEVCRPWNSFGVGELRALARLRSFWGRMNHQNEIKFCLSECHRQSLKLSHCIVCLDRCGSQIPSSSSPR